MTIQPNLQANNNSIVEANHWKVLLYSQALNETKVLKSLSINHHWIFINFQSKRKNKGETNIFPMNLSNRLEIALAKLNPSLSKNSIQTAWNCIKLLLSVQNQAHQYLWKMQASKFLIAHTYLILNVTLVNLRRSKNQCSLNTTKSHLVAH